ncbi:hypothetical protein [Thiococcus pfennigii]|uniref:hypothetical protein n=1 Tax=Thiococcus pfennigii TaxID=1057 RepID=UPI001903F645|nr:hypothetical protein [Thiococcus pfennigii]MBK1731814.1 hypothetical protein [Thiococcus pfennigii]
MKPFWWALPIGLLGLLALQWSDWPPPPTWTQAPPSAPAEPSGDLLAEFAPLVDQDAGEERSAYAEVVERPLFVPDRRPPEPEAAEGQTAVADEAGVLETLDLVAVIMTPDLTMAWVKAATDPKLLEVRAGEELAGWIVREIRSDRLALEYQGRTETLLLRTFPARPERAEPPRRAGRPGSRLRPPSNQPDRQ